MSVLGGIIVSVLLISAVASLVWNHYASARVYNNTRTFVVEFYAFVAVLVSAILIF